MFLGVGTGAGALAANASIDQLIFDYTTNGAAIGTGVAAVSISCQVPSVCRLVLQTILGVLPAIVAALDWPVNLSLTTP